MADGVSENAENTEDGQPTESLRKGTGSAAGTAEKADPGRGRMTDPSHDAVLPVVSGRTADWVASTLDRLSHSSFRSSFHLSEHDYDYAVSKGPGTIARHARELLRQRVGAAEPFKDGRQTPWRGHPVFTAQHATATCCRGCMSKWHRIPKGRALTDVEIDRLSLLVMAWIAREVERIRSQRRS